MTGRIPDANSAEAANDDQPPLAGAVDVFGRVRAGDGRLFGELFEPARPRLVRVVTFRLDRRLAGRLDPEDVVQDSYLECLKRLEHCEAVDRDTFFVWLRMVTLQTLTDLHRKHLQAKSRDANRDRSLQAPAGPDTSACLSSALADGLSSPSHHTAQAELVLLVQAALQELSPNDQEIIALRHHEELTNQEVAQVLGLQVKAASIRYIRALTRLRQVLSTVPGFDNSTLGAALTKPT